MRIDMLYLLVNKTPQLKCSHVNSPHASKRRKEHANQVTKSTKSLSTLNIENIEKTHNMLNNTHAARRTCIPPLHIPTTHPQINPFIYSRPSTLVDKHLDISTSRY